MKKITLFLAFTGMLSSLNAQDVITNKAGSDYRFTVVNDIEATEVQSQGRTGTCWSFSALSFIESEIMRMGGGKHELSEMFIVRNTYADKAEKYVRMHGYLNFGPGGAFHDVSEMIKAHGIVPLEVYTGKPANEETFNHGEMDHVLREPTSADATMVLPPRKRRPICRLPGTIPSEDYREREPCCFVLRE